MAWTLRYNITWRLQKYLHRVPSEALEGAMGPAEGAVAPIAPAWLRACVENLSHQRCLTAVSSFPVNLLYPRHQLNPVGRRLICSATAAAAAAAADPAVNGHPVAVTRRPPTSADSVRSTVSARQCPLDSVRSTVSGGSGQFSAAVPRRSALHFDQRRRPDISR